MRLFVHIYLKNCGRRRRRRRAYVYNSGKTPLIS